MADAHAPQQIALVTGASTGIGFHLAKLCWEAGFRTVMVADEPAIENAAAELRAAGADVEHVQADLATIEGVDAVVAQIGDRPVAAVLANAGRGLGHAFVDQDWDDIRRVIDTNVTGTIYLLRKLLPAMEQRGSGRVLITGSIAGFMPGTYQAVYNGTKALLDSFSFAIRHELKDSGVTVTCLMPGVTETDFFERADMLDTAAGTQGGDDPADVAKAGFDAMMRGDGDVVSGWQNKLQAAIAHVTPASLLAAAHERLAKPGTAH